MMSNGNKKYLKLLLVLLGIIIVSCSINEYEYSSGDVINQNIVNNKRFSIKVMPYLSSKPQTDSLKCMSFIYEFLFTLNSSEAIPKIVLFNVNLYTPNLKKKYISPDSIYKFVGTKAQNDDIQTNKYSYTIDYLGNNEPEEIIKKSDGKKTDYDINFDQHYYINKTDMNKYLILKGTIILDVSGKIYNIDVNKKVKINYRKVERS